MENTHLATVESFGREWAAFDQSCLEPAEQRKIFEDYFRIFPWSVLPADAVGFDLGCGSGRWAALVAPRVGILHCIDASKLALDVARKNLVNQANCQFHEASVSCIPLEDDSMDFGYSLGVLHHVPDTRKAIASCVKKLKPGAPLLLYLYYAFDNRPFWFRALWKASDFGRRVISKLPFNLKTVITGVLAITLYYPLARLAALAERLRFRPDNLPLAYYRSKSFYVMRTDSLDRFGTRLEHRFTARDIKKMMEHAGLERISFSDSAPYWCAVGFKGAS